MIAIAGGKGGCGKTTTTLGLALACAARDQPVVAIDCDVAMPDLHTLAEVPRTPTISDMVESKGPLGHPVPGESAARIAPAGLAESVDTLPAALEAIDTSATVLLDTPCGAGPDATAPLAIADGVIVVSLATRESLEDALKTATMARTLNTSVLGAVIVGRPLPPADTAEVLGVEEVYGLPSVSGDPLESPRIRRRYGHVASDLLLHRTGRRGSHISANASPDTEWNNHAPDGHRGSMQHPGLPDDRDGRPSVQAG